jgi:hypothetical protein
MRIVASIVTIFVLLSVKIAHGQTLKSTVTSNDACSNKIVSNIASLQIADLQTLISALELAAKNRDAICNDRPEVLSETQISSLEDTIFTQLYQKIDIDSIIMSAPPKYLVERFAITQMKALTRNAHQAPDTLNSFLSKDDVQGNQGWGRVDIDKYANTVWGMMMIRLYIEVLQQNEKVVVNGHYFYAPGSVDAMTSSGTINSHKITLKDLITIE